MKKKLFLALFISMLLVVPMNNNYVDAAKKTSTQEVATTNYTITYNLNGGNNNKSNPTKYNSKSKTIKLKDPTRSGYTFEGWYKDANYKKKVTTIKKGSKGNVTLYAKWQRYTITYNLNGGTNNKSNPSTYNRKSKTISLKNPTRKGYEFMGWYKDAKFKKKVTSIKKGSKGNITLYAKWESNEDYKITYNLAGGANSKSNPSKYNRKTKTISLKNPTRTGYTFSGWYKDAKFKKKVTSIKKGSKGAVTLYAKWKSNTYTIKYDKNGGKTGKMKNQTKIKYGTNVKLNANKYTKKGYVFAGWNTKKNGKGKTYADKATVKNLVTKNNGTITLYAIWKNEFRINYKLNGGTNNKANPSKRKINTEVVLKNPTRKDYKFLGWYMDANFKTKVPKISKNYNKDITLYAKWQSTKPAVKPTARQLKALNTLKMLLNEPTSLPEGSYALAIRIMMDDGYSASEAQYAADNCGIDWKNQANKFVKNITTNYGVSEFMLKEMMEEYLYTAEEIKNAIAANKVNWRNQALLRVKKLTEEGYSKQGIVKRIKELKFATADEKAAIDSINVDNKKQVIKAAKSMLKETAYSYNKISSELKAFYDFTEEEAKYGADNCGANWKEQALKYAKESLEHSSFSYQGLIKNLTSEWLGFTEEEAKYAADNCGANWKEQALRNVKETLKHSIVSYKALMKTLTNEWVAFTEEEAKYALDNSGANWKEQALKQAKEILKNNSYSYNRIIKELQQEWMAYTEEEAKYAADNCGANWKENAIKFAKENLLKSDNYSRLGLIEALQYEWTGFTEEEAIYAADNCGANWKEQALSKAKKNIAASSNTYHPSRKTLMSDLEQMYKYTAEEAKYAVDNCGENWKENALNAAKNRIKEGTYSYQSLLNSLQEEWTGFTAEEAKYAADNCGADWKAIALKYLNDYVADGAFSKEQLPELLKGQGFTEEECQYALANYMYANQ